MPVDPCLNRGIAKRPMENTNERHATCVPYTRNASHIPSIPYENWRFSIEAKYARLRTFRHWRTLVRTTVLCRSPSERRSRWTHDPTNVATSPSGSQPDGMSKINMPASKRTAPALQQNTGIISHHTQKKQGWILGFV